MAASYERRALSFNGKPVLVYVSAGSAAGAMILARCRGAGMRAEEESVTEGEYIARIQRAVRDLGFEAVLATADERQITFVVHRPSLGPPPLS